MCNIFSMLSRKKNILVIYLDLEILPVTLQPPNPGLLLREGAFAPNGLTSSGGVNLKTHSYCNTSMLWIDSCLKFRHRTVPLFYRNFLDFLFVKNLRIPLNSFIFAINA